MVSIAHHLVPLLTSTLFVLLAFVFLTFIPILEEQLATWIRFLLQVSNL